MGKEEDKELISRARKGDEQAFASLLKKYERSVYSIALRMVRNRDEARDLSQEVFAKVFAMLERYNPAYSFSSWLFKITSNLCIDSLRKRRASFVAIDEGYESERGSIKRQYESPRLNPEKEIMNKERTRCLEEAIEKLPEDYRIIILLRHQEDMAYDEIARALEVPLGTVKARIHRARRMLKDILENMGYFGDYS